ncbi:acyl carrier protein [Streptomyces iconiensis]|uniref:Acyl carrier protein n=1 Tax=Streptomyces iconiensis TaxID=1384038 RepID=A0ABT7A7M1_9ACTN|nr:acyl carrier protein [Streptomyces iconiensis]MDJ1137326.1 acyl carrier protein [Streptomyces iconiensis]
MTVEELKSVLVSMGVDGELVTPDAVREEVDLDSLGLAELALVMNREKGIPVTEDELSSTVTVADIAALLTDAAERTGVHTGVHTAGGTA